METFNLLLGSQCKMFVPILRHYDMCRLMLARHGWRTMLRDEAAKDPRKIAFFRDEWPFQDERILINHHVGRVDEPLCKRLHVLTHHLVA